MIGWILAVPALFGFSMGVLLYRNRWVLRKRLAILHADMASYEKLPSYDTMFWAVWIWDASKFIGYGEAAGEVEARKNSIAAKEGARIIERARRSTSKEDGRE